MTGHPPHPAAGRAAARGSSGQGAPGGRRRPPRPARAKERDLAGLRVVVEGRGPLGSILRALDGARDLRERGAELIVVDRGLRERVADEIRRRCPAARLVPGEARAAVLAPGADGPPPRFVLRLAPDVSLGRADVRALMARLGGEEPEEAGVAVAPRLCDPASRPLPAADGGAPPAWLARRSDLISGAALAFREVPRARALVERRGGPRAEGRP